MNKLSLLFLITGLLLGGCAAKQRVVVAKKELPSWYMQPPQSDSSTLYALGEGENQQDAITNALSLLASTLHVAVSSNFRAKTVVKEGSVNSSEATYINETQSSVEKIKISEYEILHTKKLGFKRYAVLIKVNKQKLFQGLKNELDQKLKIYRSKVKNLQKCDALKRLAYYKKMKKSFTYIQNALIVMKVLHKGFDETKYIAWMSKVNEEYDYLLKHISFWVNSNVKSLAEPLRSALTKQKFIIKNVKSNMHYTVFIHAKIKKASAYGFTLARSEISFVTKNYKGEVLGENVIHVTGQSSQGYEIARQNLVKKLHSLIQKEGISKVLNIGI
ncbi:LPP20 family lipoprotein [Sulfurimonas sp. NW7]|uniref:LPP20 family lipoprotein n=1 Tax=Sulfurimonas sp. NW7 TaxID=2922727 RepID=UPI003DA9EB20